MRFTGNTITLEGEADSGIGFQCANKQADANIQMPATTNFQVEE